MSKPSHLWGLSSTKNFIQLHEHLVGHLNSNDDPHMVKVVFTVRN